MLQNWDNFNVFMGFIFLNHNDLENLFIRNCINEFSSTHTLSHKHFLLKVPALFRPLLLAGVELFRLVLHRFNKHRQTRVQDFTLSPRRYWVCCRRLPAVCALLLSFPSRFLLALERLLLAALLLLPPSLLLLQDALSTSSLLVGGIWGVQIVQVGREHGLETRVLQVHLF